MNYRNYTRRGKAEIDALVKPAWHTTLERVLDWARGHDPVLQVCSTPVWQTDGSQLPRA